MGNEKKKTTFSPEAHTEQLLPSPLRETNTRNNLEYQNNLTSYKSHITDPEMLLKKFTMPRH